jgi:hypothetical protein
VRRYQSYVCSSARAGRPNSYTTGDVPVCADAVPTGRDVKECAVTYAAHHGLVAGTGEIRRDGVSSKIAR